jgi:hypothetical protein
VFPCVHCIDLFLVSPSIKTTAFNPEEYEKLSVYHPVVIIVKKREFFSRTVTKDSGFAYQVQTFRKYWIKPSQSPH